MMMNDAFSTISEAELSHVTGGGKLKWLWKAAKKAGGEVKKAWNSTPPSVKAGLITGGAGLGGAAAAWVEHQVD